LKEINLGIDFGTSTSLLAVPGKDWPIVLQLGKTTSWMPSVIASKDGSHWEVGENADFSDIREQIRSPKMSITNNQRFLRNEKNIEIDANEAIRMIFSEIVTRGKELDLNFRGRVRLSCPAMWDASQRKRLLQIAVQSGIVSDIDDILDEPISAGIAWWWNKFYRNSTKENGKTLVFDMGGGTLDVAVMDIYSTLKPEMTIFSSRGISMAGDVLDNNLTDYIKKRLETEKGFKISSGGDETFLNALIRREAKRVKEVLSKVTKTNFQIDKKFADIPTIEILRPDLEEIFRPQLRTALQCVEASLKEARMKQGNVSVSEVIKMDIKHIGNEIENIILAGGMSQIPIIEEELQNLMPNAKIDWVTTQDESTESIVKGIANNNQFEDLNVHRPNFNFVANWSDSQGDKKSEILYHAFSPLYSADQILRGEDNLGFNLSNWKPETEPSDRQLEITVESLGGRRVSLKTKDGSYDESIRLIVDKFIGLNFKLYVDGRIIIKDSRNNQIVARIKQWPYVRWGSNSIKENSLILEIEDKSGFVLDDKGSTFDSWRYY